MNYDSNDGMITRITVMMIIISFIMELVFIIK